MATGSLNAIAHPGDIVVGAAYAVDRVFGPMQPSALSQINRARNWAANASAEQWVDLGANTTVAIGSVAVPIARAGGFSRLSRLAPAAESNTVIFNNGWRTLDGKFASPLSSARPGGSAEIGVWDAIAAKPGWSVRTGNVAVRDASGQLRYYDGIAISPRDRIIGLEIKSGGASRTAPQRTFDTTLNSSPGNVATGVGQSTGTTVQRSILIRPGQ